MELSIVTGGANRVGALGCCCARHRRRNGATIVPNMTIVTAKLMCESHPKASPFCRLPRYNLIHSFEMTSLAGESPWVNRSLFDLTWYDHNRRAQVADATTWFSDRGDSA